MKIRQDMLRIRHRPGSEHDELRLLSGPYDRSFRRAEEPHELTRSEWEALFTAAAREHFTIVEQPVIIPDPPARAKQQKESER